MLRILTTLAIALAILASAGCGAPELGERCNPLLFTVSDQCAQGLSCIYPPNCGVAYCCPAMGTSANPNCQACPTADAGVMDSSTSD